MRYFSIFKAHAIFQLPFIFVFLIGSQKLCAKYDQWGISSRHRCTGKLFIKCLSNPLQQVSYLCQCVCVYKNLCSSCSIYLCQVISARKGEFETGYEKGGQTREHVQLAKTLGVSKLLVVVNKMDDPTVNWSKDRCLAYFYLSGTLRISFVKKVNMCFFPGMMKLNQR